MKIKELRVGKLPVDRSYTYVSRFYIPLMESTGTCCENCGRPIANIATIREANGTLHYVGMDCLETIIQLTKVHNIALVDIIRFRAEFPKVFNKLKKIDDIVAKNRKNNINITGILVDMSMSNENWLYYYYVTDNNEDSRDNDCIRLAKDTDLDMYIEYLPHVVKGVWVRAKTKK